MSAEKSDPPPYHSDEVPAAGPRNKKTVLLASYGAAITALLVATVIFGTLFYVQQRPSCQHVPKERKVKTQVEEVVDPNGEKAMEKIMTDYENHVEIITITSNTTANGAIVVLDYMKSLMSMYVPSESMCYLIGGIDKSVKSPFTESDDEDALHLTYKMASDYPAMDKTLLPQELREPCGGLPVYWLERGQQRDDGVRVKRQVDPCLVKVTVIFRGCPVTLFFNKCPPTEPPTTTTRSPCDSYPTWVERYMCLSSQREY